VITDSVTGIKGNKNLLDYSTTKVEFMPSPARSRRISSIAAFASTQLRPARYGPPSTRRRTKNPALDRPNNARHLAEATVNTASRKLA